MQNSPLVLNASKTLYASLLRFYPRRYRRRFKGEMVQVFQQVCHEIYAEGGLIALSALWLQTLGDLLKTIVEERFNEVFNMKQDIFIPIGGWSFIIWGVLLIASAIGSRTPDPGFADTYSAAETVFWYAGSLFLSIGLGGLYARFGNHLSWLGRFGLLQGIALGLVAALRVSWLPILAPFVSIEPLDMVVMLIGFGSGMVGLMLFSLDAVAKDSLPRWKLLPLITGSIGLLMAIIAAINPDIADIGAYIGTVIGLGTILIGYFLQADPGSRKQRVAA